MKLAIYTLDKKWHWLNQIGTIDVPDKALQMNITFDVPGNCPHFIDLHRQKVKKWQFVVPTCKGQTSDDVTSVTQHRTEDDVRREYPGRNWYHKITETEIEEE